MSRVATARMSELLRDQAQIIPGGTVRLCNPLVHTNAGDLSAAFRRRQFWRNAAVHEDQAPIVAGRYPDALVTGTGPHIVISGGRVVQEYIPTNYTAADLAARVEGLLGAAARAIHVPQPVVYAAFPGLRIWGHWMHEMLPRIVLAERLWPGRYAYVLPRDLAPEPTRFFNRQVGECLAAYGISPGRILPLEWDAAYRFDNLIDFSGMPGHLHALHPALLEVLRAIPGAPPAARRFSLTAVLRAASDARGLSNREAIVRVLEREGAGVLDPASAPFLAQAMAFRDSEMIVGEMGSNMAGLLYARPGTGVITLAPSGWDDGFVPRLLQITGAYFADVRGPSTAAVHDDMRVAAYSVDPEAVRDAIGVMRRVVREQPAGDEMIVDGRVIARRMGEVVLEVRFGVGGNDEGFGLHGFSHAEETGRWSDGPESGLVLAGLPADPGKLWLEIEGFGHEAPPALAGAELRVSVNGEELGRFDTGNLTRVQVPVPAEVARRGTPLAVTFGHPTCPPFGSVTGSTDMRRLGFYFPVLRVRRPG